MALTTNTHGGRRPGAGARPGNINALKAGRRSRRYDLAALMINALDVLWRDRLRLPREPKARRRRRQQLLDAANWFMRANPGYAAYTEELIRAYLARPRLVVDQDVMLHWLDQPRPDPAWLRPVLLVYRICEQDEDLGEKVSRHLIDWVMAGLRPEDPLQLEEKNDQTIKRSSPGLR